MQVLESHDGGVEAGHVVAVDGAGGESVVERLESQVVVRLEEDSFEGGLMIGQESDEAIAAVGGIERGGEDDDIALAVERFHGGTDDARGEGVRVAEGGAIDVSVGDAGGVIEVGEVAGHSGGDAVDERDLHAGLVERIEIGVCGLGGAVQLAALIEPVEVDGSVAAAVGVGGESCGKLMDRVFDGLGCAMPVGQPPQLAGGDVQRGFEGIEQRSAGRVGDFAGFDAAEVGAGATDGVGDVLQRQAERLATLAERLAEGRHGGVLCS